MDPHRIEDKDDARRLLREERRHEHHQPRTLENARDVQAPTGAGNAALVAEDDRIELDPAEIAAADAELGRHYDELSKLLAQAKELEAPLRDGTSPVAAHLRKAFHLRSSDDAGVQAVLQGYLDELDTLRQSIRRVSSDHASNDAETAATLAGLRAKSEE